MKSGSSSILFYRPVQVHSVGLSCHGSPSLSDKKDTKTESSLLLYGFPGCRMKGPQLVDLKLVDQQRFGC